MGLNFISSKDNDKERLMRSKSDNKEMIINDKADEVKKRFKSLFYSYQVGLGKLMKGSEFFFHYVYLLYYKCHQTNLN